MANLVVTNNLTVSGAYKDFKTSSTTGTHDSNTYYIHAIRIPTTTAGKYLIIHFGQFYCARDGYWDCTFLYPYSVTTYGVSVAGTEDEDKNTNGFYYDNRNTTWVRLRFYTYPQYCRYIIMGYGP